MSSPDRVSGALRAGAPVTYGACAVLPIERVVVHAVEYQRGAWFAGSVEPIAFVVRDPAGLRAFDADCSTCSLQGLIDKVPALAEALRTL